MRFSLVPLLMLQALPVFSSPTRPDDRFALRRHAAIPILDLTVIRRKTEAAAAVNQTNLVAGSVLAVSEEFKEGVVRTVGVFGSANPVQGGNLFTKMKLPANVSLILNTRTSHVRSSGY